MRLSLVLVFALDTKLLPWFWASPVLPSCAITYSHKRPVLSSTSSIPGWSLLPGNNTQLSKDTSGQSQQSKDVGLPSCLACPYISTGAHKRAYNCNRIGNLPQSKNGNFASGRGSTYLRKCPEVSNSPEYVPSTQLFIFTAPGSFWVVWTHGSLPVHS